MEDERTSVFTNTLIWFGAAVSMALPAVVPAEDPGDVRKALWLVSSA